MKIHDIFLCAILLFVNGVNQQEVMAQRAEDYFPLRPGLKYIYLGTYGREIYKETIVTNEFAKDDITLIYFINERDSQKRDAIIGSNMIGLGAYAKSALGIQTYETFWKTDLPRVSKQRGYLLLRGSPQKDDSLRITAEQGNVLLTVRVEGFESLSVPAGKFDRTLRLHIQRRVRGRVYNEYAWFAEGVGMVKRIRSTGRIDILIHTSTMAPSIDIARLY